AGRDLAPEVGMKMARSAIVDEGDVARGIRIDRRSRDIDIPPVIGRKQRQRSGRWCTFGGDRRRALGQAGRRKAERKRDDEGCGERTHGTVLVSPSGVAPGASSTMLLS